MSYRDTAAGILEDACKALRDTMADAVASEAFREVAMIARIAERLAATVAELRAADASDPSSEPRGSTREGENSFVSANAASTEPSQADKAITTLSRRDYPQYFREADRLVKRAWSKKERRPYEHKAPRGIIDVLFEAIHKRRGHERPFEAANIMPLWRTGNEEYPSYQCYLVLGWFRHEGAIAKGRDGYLLRPGWDRERIAQLWDTLPSVGQS